MRRAETDAQLVLGVLQGLVATSELPGRLVLVDDREVADARGGGDHDSEHRERDKELVNDRSTASHVAVPLRSASALAKTRQLVPSVANWIRIVILPYPAARPSGG